MIRSPFRFTALIAVLGSLDTASLSLASGLVLQRVWVDRLGTLVLPMVWAITVAVARGADDVRLTVPALMELGRVRVWLGSIGLGAAVVALTGTVALVLGGFVHDPAGVHAHSYLRHSGNLVDSIAANIVMVVVLGGVCYCPLLVLAPAATPLRALILSRKASEINQPALLWIFVGVVATTAYTASFAFPAYGMTTAVFLVFLGTLNYVAYRDIFEGRSENASMVSRVPAVARTASQASLPRSRLLAPLGIVTAPPEDSFA